MLTTVPAVAVGAGATGPGGEGCLRLADAKHVAGRVAEGGIPDSPELVGRLLQDLGIAGGLDLLERGVEVVGSEEHARQLAFCEESGTDLAVFGRDSRLG